LNGTNKFLEAISSFNAKLNDGQSDKRKSDITSDETVWSKSCLSCKNFYNQICYEHYFRINYDEAATKTCKEHLYHASEFHDLD